MTNTATFVSIEYNSKFESHIMINQAEFQGNWKEQKAKLKEKFVILTDNDLLFKDGKKEELLGRLQVKLGKTKEELENIIERL